MTKGEHWEFIRTFHFSVNNENGYFLNRNWLIHAASSSAIAAFFHLKCHILILTNVSKLSAVLSVTSPQWYTVLHPSNRYPDCAVLCLRWKAELPGCLVMDNDCVCLFHLSPCWGLGINWQWKKKESTWCMFVWCTNKTNKKSKTEPLIASETLSYPVWMRTQAEIGWKNMFVSWEIKLANFIGFKGVQG